MRGYYAGLLDGEGCVSFTNGTRKCGPAFAVSFKMSTPAAMQPLADHYGVRVIPIPDSRPNHSLCYQMRLHGVQAKDFLRQVRSRLKVKEAQADAVIRCPMQSPKRRRETADLLRELNQRGGPRDVSNNKEAA
jgi:hypothetical protein